jgi:hypothetical protein
VRQLVGEYLEDQLGCVIRRHRLGFELVSMTGRTSSNVGAFLAALELFTSSYVKSVATQLTTHSST